MIPAEAVEAAAKAAYEVMPVELFGEDGPVLWEHLGGSILGDSRKHHELDRARAALEAAVPHMLAGLRTDLVKLAKEFDTAEGGTLAYTVTDGRFGMRKNAHDQLMYVLDDHTRTPDAR